MVVVKDTLINELVNLFDNAPRMGNEKDVPEGTRYIIISDTLAKELSQKIKNYLVHDDTQQGEGSRNAIFDIPIVKTKEIDDSEIVIGSFNEYFQEEIEPENGYERKEFELFGIPIITIENENGVAVTIKKLNDDHAIRFFLDSLLLNVFLNEKGANESAFEALKSYTMIVQQFYGKIDSDPNKEYIVE